LISADAEITCFHFGPIGLYCGIPTWKEIFASNPLQPILFEVQRQWLIAMSRVLLGHPYFLVIESFEGLCNLFASRISLQKEYRHRDTVIVVIINEIGCSRFRNDIPGMWVYGTANVRLWVNTLHVLVEALLGKQLENGPCQWIKECWNAVAENRWTAKAAQVHRNAPINTKSQIKYIPCPFAECDFLIPVKYTHRL
jgi:hypothetical protein